MTEYDYSPEAYHQFQRTQHRIANWADDTAHCAHQYKSPFAPRSDVRDNEFYKPRSAPVTRYHTPSPSGSPSGSRSRSSSHGHGHHHQHPSRRTPHRSHSHSHAQAAPTPFVRSPLRSNTIAVPQTVAPDDSISQVASSRTGRSRARSHSPSSRRHHRSGTGTYVISPPQPQPQYGYGAQYGAQYVQSPQAMYAPQPPPPPQPAAYVVYPRDCKVHIVYPTPAPTPTYPPPAHPTQDHHSSFFGRLFGSHKSGSRRSRSLSRSRR